MATDSSNSDQKPPIDHFIRLHGPWQASMIRSDTGLDFGPSFATKTKLHVPGDWNDWLGPDFRGQVQFERTFGMPTGLTAEQQVWLIIEEVGSQAQIWINDSFLGELKLGQPPFRQPVLALMKPRNRLQVLVEFPTGLQQGTDRPSAGGVTGEVRLEISN